MEGKEVIKKGLISPDALLATKEKGEIASTSPESEDTLASGVLDDDLEDEAELSYSEGLDDGLKVADATNWRAEAILDKREDTRTRLAIIYTIATFCIFFAGMIIAVIDGIVNKESITSKLADIIPLISGVFLGTLGFVLGYYFRKGDE